MRSPFDFQSSEVSGVKRVISHHYFSMKNISFYRFGYNP
ncbi:hypothetical protein [Azospirillum palustre]